MKRLIAGFSILFVTALLSCGSASSGDATKDTPTSAADQAVSASATDNNASFSCKLDGREVSGKGTDQNINAAFRLAGDDKGTVAFRLSDMNDIGEKLNFEVPDKVGSTTFSATPTNSFIGYMTSDFTNYLDNPIMITITSISSSRVSGTFSGKYTLEKGSGNSNSKQTIEVTDGKFDIPFSTSAGWKKMYNAE